MSLYQKLPTAFVALSAVLLTVSVAQAAVGDTIRVNSGATAPYTDAAGKVWAADSGFVGGEAYAAAGTAFANTADPALHEDERWDDADFSYNFKVTTPGSYIVGLYNATLWDGACGEGTRVFDVTINGTKVLTNYDMSAEVGCLTAQVKRFIVVTTDGNINITFNVGTVQNPKINAIEIYPGTVISVLDKKIGSNSKLSIASSSNGISVQTNTQGAYTLELRTLRGESISQKVGFGSGTQSFSNLRPGLYVLTSNIDGQTASRTVSVLK